MSDPADLWMTSGAGIIHAMSDDLFDDEYDPLAPMFGAPANEPVSDDEAWADPDRQGGFTGAGIVRVWFEEGRLTTVRVSPIWYERLSDGETLAGAFEEAFLLASLTTADDETEESVGDIELPDLPPFSEHAVDAYAAMLHDHAERWKDAIARAADTPSEPAPLAWGEYHGVRVVLNRAGHPEHVRFDEEWLDGAQSGIIATAVFGATQQAYRSFVPPNDDHQQELDDLRREHEVLQAGFRALLQPTRSKR